MFTMNGTKETKIKKKDAGNGSFKKSLQSS